MDNPRWVCHNNNEILFSVTSNGLTSSQWQSHLTSNGFIIGKETALILDSHAFVSSSGVDYDVVVLSGNQFIDSDRNTHKIRAVVEQRKLISPPIEVACLIRDKFSNDEIAQMGLSFLVVMIDPVVDYLGQGQLLHIQSDAHKPSLGRIKGSDSNWYNHSQPVTRVMHVVCGFAFVVSRNE